MCAWLHWQSKNFPCATTSIILILYSLLALLNHSFDNIGISDIKINKNLSEIGFSLPDHTFLQ